MSTKELPLEPAPEQAAAEQPEPGVREARRETLSFQERQDVIDWLRTRAEPVIAESKVAAAKIVSEATNVPITASQLWYMIDALPKLALQDKFAIGTLTEANAIVSRDLAGLHKRMDELQAMVNHMADQQKDLANLLGVSLAQMDDRVKVLEAKAKG